MAIVLSLGFGAAAFSQAKLQTVERGPHAQARARCAPVRSDGNRSRAPGLDSRCGRTSPGEGRGRLRPYRRFHELPSLARLLARRERRDRRFGDGTGGSGRLRREDAGLGGRGGVVGARPACRSVPRLARRRRLGGLVRATRLPACGKRLVARGRYPAEGVLRSARDDRRYLKLVAKYGRPEDGKPFIRDLETGVESARNADLTGQDGKAEGLTDRHGEFMASRGSRTVQERRDGHDVQLTIVPELQVAATAAVRRQVERTHAKTGVALIMDPKTGDLLAMANWPQPVPYRPDGTENDLGVSGGSNPCTMSVLEPGSMFKILTLAKCLDVRPDVARGTIVCTGAWKPTPKSKPIHCDKHEVHGVENDRMAIAGSCNIAAGHWALAIGHDRFMQYLEDAGLKDRSRLGLPGESPALFPRLRKGESPILQDRRRGLWAKHQLHSGPAHRRL